MAAINWGYAINKPRVIDIDSNNLRKSDEIPVSYTHLTLPTTSRV